ncbi:response regulator transcription factor [Ruminococcus sp.]|uniref:response regulator transcription factor n=1 Tax=Ruminococcus sp. TaxID=41978 RepID=UPI00258B7F2B|nr:response regulator transcription factor [Ruminococcus sp.]MCR5020096.1 response regulator transcription factor [Ruminococcus sp.]
MRILIIEDDKKQCWLLQFRLEQEGYEADTCSDGGDAEFFLSQNAYDMVLLDRMLPHKDGITILREMRERGNHTPVIMLTALGELTDKITGLDCGADDYLVKPYEIDELLARIRCLLRRPSHVESLDSLCLCDVVYKTDENLLTGPADTCTLSQKEGELMQLFLRNPDQTLSRQTIQNRVWGIDYETLDGNLDNYIYFVRRRLKNIGSTLSIRTMRGVGYMLDSGKKNV